MNLSKEFVSHNSSEMYKHVLKHSQIGSGYVCDQRLDSSMYPGSLGMFSRREKSTKRTSMREMIEGVLGSPCKFGSRRYADLAPVL